MGSDPSELRSEVGSAFFDRFAELTPVQNAVIPQVLAGLDVVVISGTGTGKTEAVVAPLIQRHVDRSSADAKPSILYIVPTKALANDLRRRLSPRLARLGLGLGLRHGDETTGLSSGRCDVLVTTPESFDVLTTRTDECLAGIKAVVIDEAHLLFNTQRGMQLAILLRRLEMRTGSALQVCCASATVSDGDEVHHFFRPKAGNSGRKAIRAGTAKPIKAVIRVVDDPDDLVRVIDVIGRENDRKVLLFANSRRECDRIAEMLDRRTSFGERVYVHYSSVSAEQRRRTEAAFLEERSAVCVATSTLELGIDIGNINLVVLYGVPPTCESFLQRIGRGCRRSPETHLLCLVPWDDRRPSLTAGSFLVLLEKARAGEFGSRPAKQYYGAALQQVLSVLRERSGRFTRLADLAEVFQPWDHLSREVVDQFSDALAEQDVCQRHGFKNQICASEMFWKLESLRLLWGNFPIRSREIAIHSKGRELGEIPAANALRLSPGVVVRFAGGKWQVQRVTPTAIEVAPAHRGATAIDITYKGSAPGLDPEILEGLRQLIVDGRINRSALAEKDADPVASALASLGPILRPEAISMRIANGNRVYLTFAGSTVNRVIVEWAAAVDAAVDDFIISTPSAIDFGRLPGSVEQLSMEAVSAISDPRDRTLFQNWLPANLQRSELLGEWLQNPCFQRALARLSRAAVCLVPALGTASVDSLLTRSVSRGAP